MSSSLEIEEISMTTTTEDDERGSFATVGLSQEGAWLTQSTKTIKRSGFYMQQAIEEACLDDALRHSAVMLGELRTNTLGPLKYYEVYMTTLNMLNILELYFMEYIESSSEKGGKQERARGLYQRVQHAGNVIPRLYLLCTVGSCAIKTHACEEPEKLLRDMEDMCKGVQHPIRGLFLRAYLLHCVKEILPDDESSIRFLLENFIEMNKLWVRMKLQHGLFHMGEKEREQLADLVGKNLTQLSHLEFLDFDVYSKSVLPKILDQVVSCNDTLSQGYLMECITAVFPDDFQIGTIDQLLHVLPKLHPKVQISSVLGSLLDRLAQYSEKSANVLQNLDSIDAFTKISCAVEASIEAHQESMSGESIASMYGGLLSFSLSVYFDRINYSNDILGRLARAFANGKRSLDAKAERKIIDVLCIPLEKYSLKRTLHLENFLILVDVLTGPKKKDLAYKMAGAIPQRSEKITDIVSGRSLFKILEQLAINDADDDDILTFSKALHCFQLENVSDQLTILSEVFQSIQANESSVKCIGPTITLMSLDAIRNSPVNDLDMEDTTSLIFPIKVAVKVGDAGAPAIAISLLLRTAVAYSNVAGDKILYECFERAFIFFEEYINDSKECMTSLYAIMDALYQINILSSDTRDSLTFKARSYCSKLLRRKSQCQAMIAFSHVYWQESSINGIKNGAAVLETLDRSQKMIQIIKDQNSIMERSEEELKVPGYLFVEILVKFGYFKERGVSEITGERIKQLIDSTAAELSSDACQHDESLQTSFRKLVTSLEDVI